VSVMKLSHQSKVAQVVVVPAINSGAKVAVD
jgi:hypothetical protein